MLIVQTKVKSYTFDTKCQKNGIIQLGWGGYPMLQGVGVHPKSDIPFFWHVPPDPSNNPFEYYMYGKGGFQAFQIYFWFSCNPPQSEIIPPESRGKIAKIRHFFQINDVINSPNDVTHGNQPAVLTTTPGQTPMPIGFGFGLFGAKLWPQNPENFQNLPKIAGWPPKNDVIAADDVTIWGRFLR